MFLPKDYNKPTANSRYMKLLDGDNKIRILDKPVLGWIDWVEKDGKRSPVRTPMSEPKPEPSKENQTVKHFWAFPVWDYADSAVKILEITQSTIQDVIYHLDKDESWGDPTKYDLKINRSGKELQTEYSVIAIPPKPITEEIETAFKESNPDLNQLFTNGDPFASQKTDAPSGKSFGDLPEKEEIKVEDIPF